MKSALNESAHFRTTSALPRARTEQATSPIILAIITMIALLAPARCGCAGFPYLLEPVFRYTWGESVLPVIADFDGDGTDELASVNNVTGLILFLRLVGSSVATLGRFDADVSGETWSRWGTVGAFDLQGDGRDELLIEYVASDTLHLMGVAPQRGVVLDAPIASGLAGDEGDEEAHWDGKVHSVAALTLPDGTRGILVCVAAQADGLPRELVLLPDDLSRPAWRYPAGAMMRYLAVQDLDGDGADEVVFGSSAPGNVRYASHLPDGHSYVGVLDHDGRELWTATTGGDQTDTSVQLADLDGDGREELVSMTTPEEDAVPQVSTLRLWDITTGGVLDTAEILERATQPLVIDLEGSRHALAIGAGSSALSIWGLREGKLTALCTGDAGSPFRPDCVVHVPGVRQPVIAGATDRGRVLLYSGSLKLLAAYEPPLPTKKGQARLAGTYRRSDGTTPLLAISDELLLLTAVPVGASARMVAGAVLGLCALALGGALGLSASFRTRMSSLTAAVLAPVMPWARLERDRARLELMRQLEIGGHDKMIITRPLRRLAEGLAMGDEWNADLDTIREIAQRSIDSYTAAGRPGLRRTLTAASAWSGAPELTRRLKGDIDRVEAALGSVAAELQSGSRPAVSAEALRSEVAELESALQILRERAGEAFIAEPARVVADSIEMLSGDVVGAGARLESNLSRIVGEKAWVRAEDLQFMVSNLVSNALQAMRDASEKELRIEGEIRGSFIMLRFADTGCGIKPAYVERIFEYGETSKNEGGGTGLYRTREALGPLGGSIEVERTAVGRGTTFLVKLRRRR